MIYLETPENSQGRALLHSHADHLRVATGQPFHDAAPGWLSAKNLPPRCYARRRSTGPTTFYEDNCPIVELKRVGVAELFTPGTPLQAIVDWLRERFPESAPSAAAGG